MVEACLRVKLATTHAVVAVSSSTVSIIMLFGVGRSPRWGAAVDRGYRCTLHVHVVSVVITGCGVCRLSLVCRFPVWRVLVLLI